MMKNNYATQRQLFSWMKIGLVQFLLVVLFSGFTEKTPPSVLNVKTSNIDKNIAFIVTGIVTDVNNEPLVGASVVLEGTNKGTITDANGAYRLELDDKEANGTLVISFVGFDKQAIPIGGKTSINISLQETGALSELIVVGYGTRKKSHNTGAIASVGGAEVAAIQANRVDDALAGLARVEIL